MVAALYVVGCAGAPTVELPRSLSHRMFHLGVIYDTVYVFGSYCYPLGLSSGRGDGGVDGGGGDSRCCAITRSTLDERLLLTDSLAQCGTQQPVERRRTLD